MATLRPRFDRIWAATGQLADPGAAKYSLGWTAEIPTYEVLNFLQNRTDTALTAMAETGVPEWGDDIDYRRGAPVWSNGAVYYSKTQSPNRALRPENNPSQWGKSAITYSDAEFLALVQRIDNHANDKNNPHNVTADQIGTYRTGVIDAKIKVVQDDVTAFKARRDNPHNVTAAQAGAVPVTGGTYSGAVTFTQPETKFSPTNGNYAVVGYTDFAGIRAGDIHLGIDVPTGRPIVNKGGVKSFLLSEAEYIEWRKSVEHQYAVPVPYYEIDALSDIHIKQGVGFSGVVRPSGTTYTDRAGVVQYANPNTPRHTAEGLMIEGSIGEYLRVSAEGNLNGLTSFTFNARGIRYANQTNVFSTDSAKPERFGILPDGRLFILMPENGTNVVYKSTNVVNQLGAQFSITWVREPTRIRGYYGAELVIDVSKSFAAPLPAGYLNHGLTEPSDWRLQQVRLWTEVLTPQQISTL